MLARRLSARCIILPEQQAASVDDETCALKSEEGPEYLRGDEWPLLREGARLATSQGLPVWSARPGIPPPPPEDAGWTADFYAGAEERWNKGSVVTCIPLSKVVFLV